MINVLTVLLVGMSHLMSVPGSFGTAHKGEVQVYESITVEPMFDAYVQVGITGAGTSQDRELRIGTFDGTTVARTFLNWDVRGLDAARVKKAKLRLHATHSWSCGQTAWEVWDTEPVTDASRWDAQPAWVNEYSHTDVTSGYSDKCPDGPVEVEITELVRHWAKSGRVIGTTGLRATNETDPFSWKKFASADSEHRPAIRIDLFGVSGT